MTEATMKVLIIGGVAAGTKAGARLRRLNPASEVILVTKDHFISYAGCGLPYFLSGLIRQERELIVKKPEDFAADTGVRVLTRHEAVRIEPAKKTVEVLDMSSGEIKILPYDQLILATGASPSVPPIPGTGLGNVHTLRTVHDAVAIRELIRNGRVKHAVVVGGGFIGLEAAENLSLAGISTTVLEMAGQVLPGFEPEFAVMALQALSDHEVTVSLNERVIRFESDDDAHVSRVVTACRSYPCDLVIWAAGVRPNTELATEAGILLGPSGAIAVDEEMRTSVPDILAVGDCAEIRHHVHGAPVWAPMGSLANKTGRISGSAAAGYTETVPIRTLGTMILKLFGLNLAKTGMTVEEARQKGFQPVSALVPAVDRAHYYPGHQSITTKLIVDAGSRRVLGAQVAGPGVVDKPIDIIATLMTLQGTVDDLASVDLAYAPPFSTAIASTITAAHVVQNKLAGRFRGVNPGELHALLLQGDAMVVDVRSEPEYIIGTIPGAIHIPLEEMAQRVNELSKDRLNVLICKVGKRAYFASQLLRHLGFSNIAILEGGLASYPFELE